MSKDIWHFPRSALAQQVLGLFETGLSSALVFFAPRRMGKTEFLRKDIQPLAVKKGWAVLYFSFLDTGENVQEEYVHALTNFAETIGAISTTNSLFSRVRKIGAEAAGVGKASVELTPIQNAILDMKAIFSHLANHGKIILLMDEVQVLTRHETNQQFIAGLRTAFDIYKDSLKIIFTGSSREGLRRMFSKSTAPFFHFGQNLPFPDLDQQFTDYLSNAFYDVTKRRLDNQVLWDTFITMDKVPQLARSLVERLALNPNQSIVEAKESLLADLSDDRAYVGVWGESSVLEQLLLREVANGPGGLFSENRRLTFAKTLGVPTITVPSVQSALRVLLRKYLVGKLPDRAGYFIDDPNFKSWLQLLQ